ncbi:hypothetical protein Rsub_00463 [Raphidocelis subcapitata]|uniref:Major facilitator superfamily (MFS) profile domain-containing protein n=1 Tax=Raphidocelis subcapitata TaxID=307507 RepID=A0A2V0NMU3_9CHLO|nr:hypothetical protein Rsub_00463 [Raphidocelis subcapitata]|eukprot:GBF87752.1 hypothetical protein Rsub_00463 [Raphidocelis subcapitata]
MGAELGQPVGGGERRAPLPPAAAPQARLIIAVAIGSALEYYNAAVYGVLGYVIAPQFFPPTNVTASRLSFWATYAVSFIMQPVGALAFGSYGDRHSRRTSLLISLGMMGSSTFLIGCLPGFDLLGWAAPILLILFRCIQGLAIGGEGGTACVWLFESAPREQRGAAASANIAGTMAGILLGMGTNLLLELLLPAGQLATWGWRLPFWLGGLAAALGLFLRRAMRDPAVFVARKAEVRAQLELEELEAAKSGLSRRPSALAAASHVMGRLASSFLHPRASGQVPTAVGEAGGAASGCCGHAHAPAHVHHATYSPVLAVLRHHLGSVALQFFWGIWMASVFGTYLAYFPLTMPTYLGVSRSLVIGVTMVNSLPIAGFAWLSGWLSDRGMPRAPAAGAVLLLGGAAAAPAAWLASLGAAPTLLTQTFFLSLAGWQAGLIAPSMAVLYPTELRNTGFNFTSQLVFGVVSGVTPLIVAALQEGGLGPFFAPAPWTAGCACLGAAACVYIHYKRPEASVTPPEDQLWDKPID